METLYIEPFNIQGVQRSLFKNERGELLIIEGDEERFISLQNLVEYTNVKLPYYIDIEKRHSYKLQSLAKPARQNEATKEFYIFDIIPELGVRQVLYLENNNYRISSTSIFYLKERLGSFRAFNTTQEELDFIEKELLQYSQLYDSMGLLGIEDVSRQYTPIINDKGTLLHLYYGTENKEETEHHKGICVLEVDEKVSNIPAGSVIANRFIESFRFSFAKEINFISRDWYYRRERVARKARLNLVIADIKETTLSEKIDRDLDNLFYPASERHTGAAVVMSKSQFRQLGRDFIFPNILRANNCYYSYGFNIAVDGLLAFLILKQSVGIDPVVSLKYKHYDKRHQQRVTEFERAECIIKKGKAVIKEAESYTKSILLDKALISYVQGKEFLELADGTSMNIADYLDKLHAKLLSLIEA